jgi:hypothetical protein
MAAAAAAQVWLPLLPIRVSAVQGMVASLTNTTCRDANEEGSRRNEDIKNIRTVRL